jgi:hypothetical protein
MIEFRDSDFVPLAGFSERWRFADPLYGYVAPDLERRLRPLSAARAAEVGAEALRRHPQDPADGAGAGLRLYSDGDDGPAQAWLRALPIALPTPVVVSWRPSAALLTDWEAFVAHWDDFCHVSADDVTVWEPGAAWTLCYWHYGVLRFHRPPPAV